MAIFKKVSVLAVIAVLAVSLLSGCSQQLALSEMSPQDYEHSSGYKVPVPVNWQLVDKDEQSALFVADQGAVAVLILSEIGGVDYYTPKELLENLAEWMSGYVSDFTFVETLEVANEQQESHQLWCGQIENGGQVYADICSFAAKDSVHYYMIMLAGGDDYTAYRTVFHQMLDNFRVSRDYDAIYSQLNDQYHEELFEDAVNDMIDDLKERFELTEEESSGGNEL